MTERQAWFCPSCQKHHAPHVETCPAVAVGLPVRPIQPGTTYPYPGTAGDVPSRLLDGLKYIHKDGNGTINVATTGGRQ